MCVSLCVCVCVCVCEYARRCWILRGNSAGPRRQVWQGAGLRVELCALPAGVVCVRALPPASRPLIPLAPFPSFFFLPSLPLHIPTFYHFLYSVISQLFSHCFIFFLSLSCSIPLFLLLSSLPHCYLLGQYLICCFYLYVPKLLPSVPFLFVPLISHLCFFPS